MGEHGGIALSLVLVAALLHATWNAMIKGTGERTLVLGLISVGHVGLGVVLMALFAPPASASWIFIALSTFIHWFYYWFLLVSYRLGDLSQVYPVARGIAPLLVTAGAFLFAGEVPAPVAVAGIVAVSFGIMILMWSTNRDRTGLGALTAALATGSMIASYSVVDGLGVRAAVSPLGYIGWLFFFEGLVAFFIFWRERHKLQALPAATYKTGLAGGLFSATAYGLVIYAKTLAPLGAISAVRESSVIIAALIGVIWLGERPWRLRVIAAIIVAGGILTLALLG